MTPFNRRSFDQGRIKKVLSRARSIPPYLTPLTANVNEAVLKLEYDVHHLLFLLDLIIGGKAASVLLQTNPMATLKCTDAIIDNYLLTSPTDKVQDLQLTLATNVIMLTIKSTRLQLAAVDGAADMLLKECQFPTDFKLAIRQQLFDNELIDQPFVRIIYY